MRVESPAGDAKVSDLGITAEELRRTLMHSQHSIWHHPGPQWALSPSVRDGHGTSASGAAGAPTCGRETCVDGASFGL